MSFIMRTTWMVRFKSNQKKLIWNFSRKLLIKNYTKKKEDLKHYKVGERSSYNDVTKSNDVTLITGVISFMKKMNSSMVFDWFFPFTSTRFRRIKKIGFFPI